MRATLQVLAALLLAAVFAAPAAAVTPGGAADETISGILETAQVERGDKADHFAYTLRTASAIIPLDFDHGSPRALSGSRVSVTGVRTAGALRVKDATVGGSIRIRDRAKRSYLGAWSTETSGTELSGGVNAEAVGADSVDAKRIAVVMFNFSDDRSTPFTKAQALDALVNSSASAKQFYEEESKGAMSIAGAAFGWYQLAAASTGCSWSTWTTLAMNAANAAGANLAAYTNVMFIFPSTNSCGWAGLGYVPGAYTYLNGTISVQVMTHELGHNFGLSHANAASCAVSGTRVMIAATSACTTQTYADPFSTMGNNALRHNHGSQLGELGWLSAPEKVVAVPGNSYTITPYFGAEGIHLVRVPRGDGTFFDLDVRMPYGSFDTFAAGSPAVAGVTVRIGEGTASPSSSPQATLLLDSTPATSSLSDAPLAVGKTMTDPVSKVSITPLSIESTGIVVRVREGIVPTAPASLTASSDAGAVTLHWNAATDNTAVTGYRVTRGGTEVATPGAAATSWTDDAAQPGAAATYSVAAVDGSGNTSSAATVSINVPGEGSGPAPTPTPDPTDPPINDEQAPTAPDELAGDAGIMSVTLDWTAATDDTGVVAYRITRNGTFVGSPTGTTWRDTGRAPGTEYAYTVAALDAVGNVSDTAAVTVRTLPDTVRPSPPRHLHRVSRSGSYVTFDWSSSTDNVGVVRYYIYKVGRSAPVATARISKIRIHTVRGARYYVRAVDRAGNRSSAAGSVLGRR